MRSVMRRAVAIGLAALAVGAPIAPAPAQAGGSSCQDLNVPVTVIGQQTMYGRLCEPAAPARTALVLVPGATYTGDYWDLPPELGLYSFRAGMNGAGYATMVVDRLGSGRSSRPLSATLTALVQAAAVHQIIQRLRAGAFGTRYDKVIVGGHSLGGAISVLEAATYHDVDGVLMAGISHHLDAVDTSTKLFPNFSPAALDPRFAGRGYDPGYLTTLPGTRELAFHNPAVPTPAAIAHDESTKDVWSATEAADAVGVAVMSPYSTLITVPVLLAVSSGDELMCGAIPLAADCSSAAALRRQEAPYFAPEAQLEVYLHPGGYGHSFNYAPNAGEFQRTVADWANRMVGLGGNVTLLP
jgi:pimeloyl-ACP methyl ester carboxylesterase